VEVEKASKGRELKSSDFWDFFGLNRFGLNRFELS
jgi:hypothetical protein